MKPFTIENDTNNISAHATVQEAEAVANAERFRNESGLSKLAADWPASRLVEIWNSLPGVEPRKALGQVAHAATSVALAVTPSRRHASQRRANVA